MNWYGLWHWVNPTLQASQVRVSVPKLDHGTQKELDMLGDLEIWIKRGFPRIIWMSLSANSPKFHAQLSFVLWTCLRMSKLSPYPLWFTQKIKYMITIYFFNDRIYIYIYSNNCKWPKSKLLRGPLRTSTHLQLVPQAMYGRSWSKKDLTCNLQVWSPRGNNSTESESLRNWDLYWFMDILMVDICGILSSVGFRNQSLGGPLCREWRHDNVRPTTPTTHSLPLQIRAQTFCSGRRLSFWALVQTQRWDRTPASQCLVMMFIPHNINCSKKRPKTWDSVVKLPNFGWFGGPQFYETSIWVSTFSTFVAPLHVQK